MIFCSKTSLPHSFRREEKNHNHIILEKLRETKILYDIDIQNMRSSKKPISRHGGVCTNQEEQTKA
jgi:hypothetical protein